MASTTTPAPTPRAVAVKTPMKPRGWPQDVWYHPSEAPSQQAYDQSAAFAALLLTSPEVVEAMLSNEATDPLVAKQARLRAQHADTIKDIQAKLQAARNKREVDKAVAAAKKEALAASASAKPPAKLPKSVPTAVQVAVHQVLNGLNMAMEESDAILAAKDPEDLHHKQWIQKYGAFLEAAQKNRRDDADALAFLNDHLKTLATPPSGPDADDNDAFIHWAKHVRETAVKLAEPLWKHRKALPAARSRASANQRARKKRATNPSDPDDQSTKKKSKKPHDGNDSSGDDDDDVFDNEQKASAKMPNKKRARQEDDDEVNDDDEHSTKRSATVKQEQEDDQY